jgi:hypothetical protein
MAIQAWNFKPSIGNHASSGKLWVGICCKTFSSGKIAFNSFLNALIKKLSYLLM